MKTLTDQLATYASYHRDRRNIGSHFLGVPMILFSVLLLMSRPLWMTDNGIPVTPALLASVLVLLYYLRLDIPLGILMSGIFAGMLILAAPLARGTTTVWLIWAISLFVAGWIIQALGHIWEGKKPAFLDDIMGLVIGPLFVVTELVFMLGGRAALQAEIESRAGKTRIGRHGPSNP